MMTSSVTSTTTTAASMADNDERSKWSGINWYINLERERNEETKKAKDMNANYTNPNIVTQKQNQLGKQLAVEKKTPVETNIEMHKCPEEPRRKTKTTIYRATPRNLQTHQKNRTRKLHQTTQAK